MNEELKIIISAEIDKLRSELQNAQKQVNDFANKGDSALTKFGNAAKTVGKAVGVGMAAVGAAVAAGGAALLGLAESTREYRTEQAKLVAAFEASGSSAEQAKETYNDLYRVLGDSGQATEAAQHLAKLTQNEKDLSQWTHICQGVYATFGDSLPLESLTEAVNHSAKLGEVQGSLADALEWSGISIDEFNEQLFYCNTESEREKLIRDTLNGLYSEAADTYETTAASILSANEAQALLTDSMAQLGAAAEPITAVFKSTAASLLSELVPSFEVVSQGLMDSINGVEGGAEKMAEGIKGIINTVLTKVTEMLPMVLQVGSDIIVALLDGLVTSFPSIIETIANAIPRIITLLGEMIPQITGALLNALPLILDTILKAGAQVISTLGVILPQILTQIVEVLPSIIQTLIDNIPVLLEAAISFFMAIVEAIPQIIPPLVSALPELIDSLLTTVLANIPVLLDAAVDLFMALVDAIPILIPVLVDAIPQIVDSVVDALIEAIPIILDGALKLFFAIVDAIPLILPQLLVALGQIVLSVQLNLATKLGKVFTTIWDSIVVIFKNVGTHFGNWFKNAFTGIKNAFSGVAKFFSGIWDSIKKIFSNVGATIGNAIKNTVSTAINGVLSSAVSIINGFIKAINTAISVINAIPGVNIKKINELSVPKLERGGVLKKGQVGLLEGSGAEAVVPLEKNTEWLDKIAERLGKMLGNDGTPIVLQVDGKTFAKTAVSSINNLTRQQGKLSLNLV